MTQHLIEKKLSSDIQFTGNIIEVSLDHIQLPNGKTATREVVRHCPAVCVLAVTDDEKVILVRQFRYPCNEVLLEVPAGKMDLDGESALDCAFRELAEETPYTATSMTLRHTFYTAPGFCDELMYLYEAKGVKKNSALTPDEDEFVETVLLSKEETLQAMRSGQIKDAKTLIALQFWLLGI
ncbi:NUDIX hydrolase [Basilea psittacipulmonis]|uniref:GDP-mannose pyrophosphatase n=1 Tax=Basilea psittacipulmonis DSM 24701 TaxID=1072685 RepID=A0A077DIR0_9BURK|nr:NUDIX hydrolase [Basilea psittacipulmonis]AIL33048.1 ADP-ribose pyrophosphatase [Basilea psittacipulmonis DSM 24701]